MSLGGGGNKLRKLEYHLGHARDIGAGLVAMGRPAGIVKSYAVLAERDASRETALQLARGASELLGSHAMIDIDAIEVDASHLGEGYGVPTDGMKDAVRLMASKEGVLLDLCTRGKHSRGCCTTCAGEWCATGRMCCSSRPEGCRGRSLIGRTLLHR